MPFSPTEIAVAVWLLAMGGAVGSFLNVVIYRLPAGMSLIRPGSQCPRCKRPIRWYDNVPVLGWLMLRGRCRDCRAPIAQRYPAIEALTALVFVGMGALELLARGANLPNRPVAVTDGLIFPPLGSGELAGILAYHLLLVSTLLAAAMIQYDGKRQPRRLLGPAMFVGGLAPLAWPHLHPVPAWAAPDGWFAGLVDSAVGLAAGWLVGLAVAATVRGERRLGLAPAVGCVGLFLGWQAVAVVGLATAILSLLSNGLGHWRPSLGRIPPLMWLTLVTVVWLLTWKSLFALWPS